jgi:hypothetical protein
MSRILKMSRIMDGSLDPAEVDLSCSAFIAHEFDCTRRI